MKQHDAAITEHNLHAKERAQDEAA